MGLAGVRYILDASEGLPLSVYVMAPSCVPATHMETAGAELSAADIQGLWSHKRVIGLAEMMNFPGVLSGDEDVKFLGEENEWLVQYAKKKLEKRHYDYFLFRLQAHLILFHCAQ